MTEAGGGSGRAEVESKIVRRSLQDEDFRRRLLEDPKGALEQELGILLPEGVEVRTVEESADSIYLVLPSASAAGGEGGDISDRELEAVAGGDETWGWTCDLDCAQPTMQDASPGEVCIPG